MIDERDANDQRQQVDGIKARKSGDEEPPQLAPVELQVGVRIGEYEARQDEEERDPEPSVVQDIAEGGRREPRIGRKSGARMVEDDGERRKKAQAREGIQRRA